MIRRARGFVRKLVGQRPADRPVILMYHRIAEPAVDPWGLSVSPANFRSQLETLTRHRQPLPMDEFVARLIAGRLPQKAVGLTFDDGYVDNLQIAKPMLAEADIPATIFIATGWIGATRLFWWDELARLILENREAFDASVELGDDVLRLQVPATTAEPNPRWRTWHKPQTERERLYYDTWERLQRLDAETRDAAIASLASQIGPVAVPQGDLPMTESELAGLPARGIAIGGHAHTHQPLTSMSPETRHTEIADCRAICTRIIGGPGAGFAFPHGDADDIARRDVRDAGYEWALSTHSAAVPARGYDLYDLPRLRTPDVDGPTLLKRMRAA